MQSCLSVLLTRIARTMMAPAHIEPMRPQYRLIFTPGAGALILSFIPCRVRMCLGSDNYAQQKRAPSSCADGHVDSEAPLLSLRRVWSTDAPAEVVAAEGGGGAYRSSPRLQRGSLDKTQMEGAGVWVDEGRDEVRGPRGARSYKPFSSGGGYCTFARPNRRGAGSGGVQ